MYSETSKIHFISIAIDISEWIERNWGYFVNKNSDKNQIIKDFANELERLPNDAMSYIQQIKNNLIDEGGKYPPTPSIFIYKLKIINNIQMNKTNVINTPKTKMRTILENLFLIKNDANKIKYIKRISREKIFDFQYKTVVKMEMESILKRNNYSAAKISRLLNEK